MCAPNPQGPNSFLGKIGKIVCWRPLEGWRPHLEEILHPPLNTCFVDAALDEFLCCVDHAARGRARRVRSDERDPVSNPVVVPAARVGALYPPTTPLVHLTVSSNQEAVSNVNPVYRNRKIIMFKSFSDTQVAFQLY